METKERDHQADEKKWALIFHELDGLLLEKNSSNLEKIVTLFEGIDKKFRENHAQKYYFEMWKIAFSAGKIKLAKNYANFIYEHLLTFKRIPALKKFIEELKIYGLLKDNSWNEKIDYLLGKITNENDIKSENWQLIENHPQSYKYSRSFLNYYLAKDESWTIEEWKLAYEFILKFHFDKDLFTLLANKAIELNKEKALKNFLVCFQERNISIKQFKNRAKNNNATKEKFSEKILKLDYDQIAMDVISGELIPKTDEQRKVIITLQDMTDEELKSKGKDMIVAFGLLGMEKVVLSLCERIIPLLSEVQDRASVQYLKGQTLFECSEYHQVIDLANEVIQDEPLLKNELIAFEYLKAEAFFKLKKYKFAKEIYTKIKKHNSNYRLVGERLKYIEASK